MQTHSPYETLFLQQILSFVAAGFHSDSKPAMKLRQMWPPLLLSDIAGFKTDLDLSLSLYSATK